MIKDERLLQLNKNGIIPGPGETEEAFLLRADYCEKLHKHFPVDMPDEMESISAYSDALNMSRRCFDIVPTWIPLFFSNYQLRFWQGGCAWIFQQSEELPTAAFFQLRRTFRSRPAYLGLYHRDEIISHETAHAGRMMFQEPKYEELLAYQTAASSFRKWFGPLVQSSKESMLFVLLLFFTMVFDLYHVFFDTLVLPWFKLLPLGMLVYTLYRLYRKQKTFERAKKRLGEVSPHADAVLYRLRDKEIDTFAFMDAQSIRAFAEQQRHSDLRWRLIALAYF